MPPKKKVAGEEVKLSADEVLEKLVKNGLRIGLDIPEQEWLSTGNMAIDAVTGGGIPLGRVTTLAGPYASGKTTCAVSTASTAIQLGGRALFCDYERTLDKPYFRSLGVDPDDKRTFSYAAPRTLEEGFNTARELMKTGEFTVVIFDSVAKMLTEKQRTEDISSGMDLEKAKLLRAALSQAADYAADTNTAFILLNHLTEKVDITWTGQQLAARGIKQYISPGGTGPGFYSSLMLYFMKLGAIKAESFDPVTNTETKRKIGYKHKIIVEKNKVAKPDGETEVVNILGEGFSNSRTAFEVLKAYGLVHKSGSWYTTRNELATVFSEQMQGEENFYQALFSDPAAKGAAIDLARGILLKAYDDLDSKPDDDEVGSPLV